MIIKRKKIIIAGPCAADSKEEVLETARKLRRCGIDAFRASLWKPRTQPGFEGVGEQGIDWLVQVAKTGLTIATEVMVADHISSLVKKMSSLKNRAKLIVWLGSRNQNHLIQKEIALRLLQQGPKDSLLLIKNQPWEDEHHWLGIVEHILTTGFLKKRLLLCHRGFAPNGHNPYGFRNVPNFLMAMRVKEKTGIPMLLDPSHIGGSVENVTKTVKQAQPFAFDGLMIEVALNPKQALTDSQQQLTIDQFDEILKLFTSKL